MGTELGIVERIMQLSEEEAVASIEGLTEDQFAQLAANIGRLSRPIADEMWRVGENRAET